MKSLLFALLMTGFAANANQFLCPDGSLINRPTSAKQIVVTLDGRPLTCVLQGSSSGGNRCSDNPPAPDGMQCNNLPVGQSCITKFGQAGQCYSVGNADPDGSFPCLCDEGG